jgi:hypothetical protein
MTNEGQQLALGVRKFSKAIDVSPRFVWDEIKRGNLTPTRLGKRVVVSMDEAQDYLRRNREKQGESNES